MKVLTVLGARPQFIKASVVSRQLAARGIEEIILHTGQHHDANMNDVFFEEMEIKTPAYNLGIHGLDHGTMTGRMLEQIEAVILREKPAHVLVYGDTNSTLAGALAAVKCHVPIAHVEAGLRSFNMRMPEEINRILTDRISQLLFCPTATAVANLKKEGFDTFKAKVINCGDVMYDAVLYFREKARKTAKVLQREALNGKPFVLVTLHRAENTNDPKRLREICNALNEINKKITVVLPLHPRTSSYLSSAKISLDAHIIEPVGYFDMLSLLDTCTLVMTDSGGLQKESYFFGKFCITLRDQTEWTELVEAGANAIAGAKSANILELFEKHSNTSITPNSSLYGDGSASQRIAKVLSS